MQIKKFLSENDIQPRKELDQFFLQNEEVLNQEIELANLSSDDIVLEIGAGFGNLTEKIAKKCRTIAVETDKRFLPFLEKINNVNIINDDAVKFLKSSDSNFNKVISNIPYSLSQEIILELLKHKWEIAVLIVQKEFAEKMLGKNKLGLLLADCADIKVVRNIPAKYFTPEAVDSSLVLIEQDKIMDEDLWSFLKTIYRNKNKNAGNVAENCPHDLKKKKIHQLSIEEISLLFNLQRLKRGKCL